jgi:hypothetical protein
VKPADISGGDREYLKAKINELATYSANKNIRDLYSSINEFRRAQLGKESEWDLLADSHSTLHRWKTYFSVTECAKCQYVRQMEIHTAERKYLVPVLFELEVAIAKPEKYKSPGTDQIPAELIKAGGEMLLSAIHKLINSIWNRLLDRRGRLLVYQFTRGAIKLTDVIIVGSASYKMYPISSSDG